MNIDSLRQQLNAALTELEKLREMRDDLAATAADMERMAADPYPVPVVIVGIVQFDGFLRVDLAAASEMAFELHTSPDLGYDKAIAAICHVAPAMLAYDVALMEAADDGGRTRIPLSASEPVKDFVNRYRGHLKNISVALPPFEKL